jgi:hypothetical protein
LCAKFNTMRLLVILSLIPFISFSQFCDPNGNVVLYSNYDGGELIINVDEDIQDLKIGVVSYEAVRVVFTGTYVNNVTGIVIAGFAGLNNPCGLGLTGNSIVNYPGGSLLMTTSPSVTLSNPNGNGNIICAYSCDISSNQGGCNTVDQIEDYMLTQFTGGSIRSHTVQYDCWTTDQLVSEGGNCCLTMINDPISIDLTGTNLTCFESCDGEISASVTGGDGSYSYSWTGSNETTADIDELCAGEYTLTVTDGTGTQAAETIVILEPNEINLAISIAQPIICNSGEATVQVTASEGVEPYTGDGTQAYPAGYHMITVEDANGCEVNEMISITEPDPIEISSSVVNAINDCIGSVELTITGGDAPYNVEWNAAANNQTGTTANNLCAGQFCADITDANGCEVEYCATVDGNAATFAAESEFELFIYPNPSKKVAALRLTSSAFVNGRVDVFDNQGRLVSTKIIQNQDTEVRLAVAKTGNYLVRLSDNVDKVVTRRWVVID